MTSRVLVALLTGCGGGATATSTAESSASTGSEDSGGVTDCDVFQQNCDPSAKCLPTVISHIIVIVEDDATAWCSPVSPTPAALSASCQVDRDAYRDESRSYDDCDAGLVCWGVTAEGAGRCEALCTGNAADPVCPEDHFCPQGWGVNGVVCVSSCDPLVQDCASATDACYLLDGRWGCYPRDATTVGTTFRPCSFANDCAPSFACVSQDEFPGCVNPYVGCCAPICDLDAPDAQVVCASEDPTFSCVEWPPEGTAVGYENVGACLPA